MPTCVCSPPRPGCSPSRGGGASRSARTSPRSPRIAPPPRSARAGADPPARGPAVVDEQPLPAELAEHPLLVVGGRQRGDRSLLERGAWYGYGLGVVLRVGATGVETALEYTSRPGTCGA